MVPFIFILGITVGAFGGILMKIGAGHMGPIEINSFQQFLNFLIKLFTDIAALSGMALYFFSALIWSYLLTKLDISYVQPILALTYVATPILAIFILHEHVPSLRWVGIAVIILGVFIVARSSAT
jgi:drug/metabolite transporter (DMT)-like permease